MAFKEYALALILGHELAGRIEDVGKDMAAKQGLQPGQMIAYQIMRFTPLTLKVNVGKSTDRIWMCAKMINLNKH